MIRESDDNDRGADHPRAIRSFVLRQGRITAAQQRAFAQHWSRFGIDYMPSGIRPSGTRPTGSRSATRDLDALFGRSAPHVLEIGFGNGEALNAASEHDPDRDYLGIEVHRPGVGRLMNALAARDAPNVRVWCHDAVEVIEHDIAPGALNEVRIWFPDPWHKKRHHKRRLIQPGFVDLLAGRLQPGALLHLATDWADYAAHMRDVLDASPAWRNRAGDGGFSPRPAWRGVTRFEQRGVRLGHDVFDLLYHRV